MNQRLLLTSCAAALFASSIPAQIVTLTGDIYDGKGGPLTTGTFHCNSIRVPAGKRLTIRGCNLKFNDRAVFNVEGSLDLSQGAYMTSVHDDSIGGDTNGNGKATVPKPGNWAGLRFASKSGGAVMNSTVVRYAGLGGTPAIRLPTSNTSVFTLTYSVVADCAGDGVDTGTVRPFINQTLFHACAKYPLVGHVFALDLVTNCTARLCGLGDHAMRHNIGSVWPNPATTLKLQKRQTMNGSGVFVSRGWIAVPAGRKLVVPAGSVWKFLPGSGFRNQGDLEVPGTSAAPVVLTSIKDDTAGGDTNKDGTKTRPQARDWNLIMCGTPGSLTMRYAEVRYAGGIFGGAVRLTSAATMIEHCKIRDAAGFGIRASMSSSATAKPVIRDCRFENITGPVIDLLPLDSLPNCRRNVHGPGTRKHIVVDGVCRFDTTITRENVPEGIVHMAGTLSGQGKRLTIGAGLAFKLSARYAESGIGQLQLLGTADAPIVLTSVHDDTVGGDTNGNGNSTVPRPGNWYGVRFLRSTASRIEFTHVKYAGVGFFSQSTNAQARCVRVEHAQTDGVRISNLKGALENFIVRDCGDNGIELSNAAVDVRHASVAANKGAGITRSGGSWTGKVRNSIAWGNAKGNFGNLKVADVFHSCGGFAGQNGNLSVDPKFVNTALALSSTSPCINTADLGTGIATALDYSANSRVSDWDYTGRALPDMGAHELVGSRLVADKPLPRVGESITFRVDMKRSADAGTAVFCVGLEDASAYLPPFGMLNAGVLTHLVFARTQTGKNVVVPIPNAQVWVGVSFAVQGLAVPARVPRRGSMTNVYRATVLGR